MCLIAQNDHRVVETSTVDLLQFLIGVIDSRFIGGPSFGNTGAYCDGYAAGDTRIDRVEAVKITKNASLEPKKWRLQ
jgi:hypothetical protein